MPSESAGVDPADLRLSSYDFALPQERIAQRPVEPRHAARLLVVDPAGAGPAPHARHRTAWDLQHELRPGDLLVVNDTRVLRARLEARRPGGGAVELLVVELWPGEPGQWLCLARPAKKLRPGDSLEVVAGGQPPLAVQVVGSDPATGGRIVQFPANDAAQIEHYLAAVRSAGLVAEDVEIRKADLEDVFLDVMGAHA